MFARQQELSKKDFPSKQAYEDAAAQLRSAEAQLKSAEEALKLIIEGPRKEEITAAQASYEAAVAQKQVAETALGDAQLYAPADGIILTRAAEPGAIMASGATVYTLSLQKPVWVRAYIGEPQLGLIPPGARVQVFTDMRPGAPYEGQVGFISPVAEFTPKSVETPELRADLVYRFRVVVTNADSALRQGMPVTLRLSGGEPLLSGARLHRYRHDAGRHVAHGARRGARMGTRHDGGDDGDADLHRRGHSGQADPLSGSPSPACSERSACLSRW